MQPVIVIPAFNRAGALSRLLESVGRAEYPDVVNLIISLEGGASEEVKTIAYAFNAHNLKVRVVEHEEQLGLRNHIIECGDYSDEFGSVVVLEDDLIVDRYFYIFAQQALGFYRDDAVVAGIALYAYEYNEFAKLPFTPMQNGYSVYPMRITCSWGQAWTRSQWSGFRHWYKAVDHKVVSSTLGLPDRLKRWPESSWKKYFSSYLVERGLFFIFPYTSLSSNCSDAGGTHILMGTDLNQVNMACFERPLPDYSFCPAISPEVSYDAFMEPSGAVVERALGLQLAEFEVDLYGIKRLEFLLKKKYVLTSRKAVRPLKKFPLMYRPLESNLLFDCDEEAKSSISLVSSTEFASLKQRPKDLDELSYFANFTLRQFRLFGAICWALPSMIWGEIVNRWSRR
jgi:glycosyltransferase involved in cell wall biosynthesis